MTPPPLPRLLRTLSEMRAFRHRISRLALIPTMGALHAGHMDLLRHAYRDLMHHDPPCGMVVSVYVNETQFAPGEDFDQYPRSLQQDMEMIQETMMELSRVYGGSVAERVETAVFHPSTQVMYPSGVSLEVSKQSGTYVEVQGNLTRYLEASIRPHFFRGVTTIVTKLLNATQADVVYFGQKDVQQCVVVKRMMEDLVFATDMKVIPTVREVDGVALSSRNRFLTVEERKEASGIYQGLVVVEKMFLRGERSVPTLTEAMTRLLSERMPHADIQYVKISHPQTLEDISERIGEQGAILSVAVKMLKSGTRLIDNTLLGCRL